uniref:BTB domain-containing protein n=1 Tax=Panagrellus redivivus TaxID=6233 RepID=A0A7E4ZU54_PANRE
MAASFADLEKKIELDLIALAGLNVLPYNSLTQHALRLADIGKMFAARSDVQGTYHCVRRIYEVVRIAGTKPHIRAEEEEDKLLQTLQCDIKTLRAKVLAEFAGKTEGDPEAGCALLSLRIPDILDILGDMDHYPTDAELVVDGQSIKVHCHFLCMLSPVFQACFSHDTRESMTGIIEITDFDLDVVQSVVDFCYGRQLDKPILHIVSMLRFADKYDIKCVTKKLGHYPSAHLNLDNFCIMARYAWDLEKDGLKEDCIQLYRRNLTELTLTSDFANLPIHIREDILRCAIALRQIDPVGK